MSTSNLGALGPGSSLSTIQAMLAKAAVDGGGKTGATTITAAEINKDLRTASGPVASYLKDLLTIIGGATSISLSTAAQKLQTDLKGASGGKGATGGSQADATGTSQVTKPITINYPSGVTAITETQIQALQQYLTNNTGKGVNLSTQQQDQINTAITYMEHVFHVEHLNEELKQNGGKPITINGAVPGPVAAPTGVTAQIVSDVVKAQGTDLSTVSSPNTAAVANALKAVFPQNDKGGGTTGPGTTGPAATGPNVSNLNMLGDLDITKLSTTQIQTALNALPATERTNFISNWLTMVSRDGGGLTSGDIGNDITAATKTFGANSIVTTLLDNIKTLESTTGSQPSTQTLESSVAKTLGVSLTGPQQDQGGATSQPTIKTNVPLTNGKTGVQITYNGATYTLSNINGNVYGATTPDGDRVLYTATEAGMPGTFTILPPKGNNTPLAALQQATVGGQWTQADPTLAKEAANNIPANDFPTEPTPATTGGATGPTIADIAAQFKNAFQAFEGGNTATFTLTTVNGESVSNIDQGAAMALTQLGVTGVSAGMIAKDVLTMLKDGGVLNPDNTTVKANNNNNAADISELSNAIAPELNAPKDKGTGPSGTTVAGIQAELGKDLNTNLTPKNGNQATQTIVSGDTLPNFAKALSNIIMASGQPNSNLATPSVVQTAITNYLNTNNETFKAGTSINLTDVINAVLNDSGANPNPTVADIQAELGKDLNTNLTPKNGNQATQTIVSGDTLPNFAQALSNMIMASGQPNSNLATPSVVQTAITNYLNTNNETFKAGTSINLTDVINAVLNDSGANPNPTVADIQAELGKDLNPTTLLPANGQNQATQKIVSGDTLPNFAKALSNIILASGVQNASSGTVQNVQTAINDYLKQNNLSFTAGTTLNLTDIINAVVSDSGPPQGNNTSPNVSNLNTFGGINLSTITAVSKADVT